MLTPERIREAIERSSMRADLAEWLASIKDPGIREWAISITTANQVVLAAASDHASLLEEGVVDSFDEGFRHGMEVGRRKGQERTLALICSYAEEEVSTGKIAEMLELSRDNEFVVRLRAAIQGPTPALTPAPPAPGEGG